MPIEDPIALGRVYHLAEHIELQKAGWWPEAIDRTLLYELFATAPQALSQSALLSRVVSRLGAEADRTLVSSRLEALMREGKILSHASKFSLPEDTFEEMHQLSEEAVSLETDCENAFLEAFKLGSGLATATTWDQFKSLLIMPLIRELGAETYGLLRGEVLLLNTKAHAEFLDLFSHDEQHVVQSRIMTFLDPESQSIRKFVLANLTSYMLVASSAVDRRVLSELQVGNGGDVPSFNILLDTNVIFSILDLHRNPLNEASNSILTLVKSTKGFADVKLFVLPSTLDEAVHALEGACKAAPSGIVTKNLASAAVNVGETSGLMSRYLEAAAGGRALSPTAYFQPYIDGLEYFLRERGIEVVSDDLGPLTDRPGVKKRITDWHSFEYDRPGGRTRDRITHDVIALEFIKDKRGGATKRLADAGWWFVTVDFWLQRQEKRDLQGTRTVVKCINPAELAQLLRFWVPRSQEMEQAIVGAIRMPFSFFSYDRRVERICIKILDRLSGYANVGDFGQHTIEQLLTDQSLRAAMESAPVSDHDSLVDGAIERRIEINDNRVGELEREKLILERELQTERANAKRSIEYSAGRDESKRRLQEKISSLTRQIQNLKSEKGESKSREAELKQARAEVERLSRVLDDVRSRRELASRRIRSVSFAIAMLFFASATVWIFGALNWADWSTPIRLSSTFAGLLTWWGIGLILLRFFGLVDTKWAAMWHTAFKNFWIWAGAGVVSFVVSTAMSPLFSN